LDCFTRQEKQRASGSVSARRPALSVVPADKPLAARLHLRTLHVEQTADARLQTCQADTEAGIVLDIIGARQPRATVRVFLARLPWVRAARPGVDRVRNSVAVLARIDLALGRHQPRASGARLLHTIAIAIVAVVYKTACPLA
jgi:hypothetical protein